MNKQTFARGLTLFLFIAAAPFISSPDITHAATVNAVLSITPATGTVAPNGNLPVDIIVDSGGQQVGGVDIYLTIPANLTYVSYDASTSVLATGVTQPTVSGSRLHLARALNLSPATPYTGSNGEVIHLVFAATSTAGDAVLAIDQSSSSVATYESTPTNILSAVQNGNYTVSSPSSSPTATPTVAVTKKPTVSVAQKVPTLPVTGIPFLPGFAVIVLGFTSITLGLRAVLKDK